MGCGVHHFPRALRAPFVFHRIVFGTMALFWTLLLQSPREEFIVGAPPLGIEWLTIASVIVPAVLLAVIIYLGSEKAVH